MEDSTGATDLLNGCGGLLRKISLQMKGDCFSSSLRTVHVHHYWDSPTSNCRFLFVVWRFRMIRIKAI
ncbi:hypothetical protein ANCCAN_24253 [Ancylostoma caninum]|uniref:Uncharacterized protein n=1 Tax=Ancylostoma caninum TaxID=29170 RepID=A0A368FCV3_ANCCA|nr:hypothetical protein ANCCAN_24253 [Ancylostoma caninum]